MACFLVAWKAAMRDDCWGMALRTTAGRSCWASGAERAADELMKVENMRCEAVGAWQACLSRPGRKRGAIVDCGGRQDSSAG